MQIPDGKIPPIAYEAFKLLKIKLTQGIHRFKKEVTPLYPIPPRSHRSPPLLSGESALTSQESQSLNTLKYSLSNADWEGVVFAANAELLSEGHLGTSFHPQEVWSHGGDSFSAARLQVHHAIHQASEADFQNVEPGQQAMRNKYSALLQRSMANTTQALTPAQKVDPNGPSKIELNLRAMQQRAAGALGRTAEQLQVLRETPTRQAVEQPLVNGSKEMASTPLPGRDSERFMAAVRFEHQMSSLENAMSSQGEDTRALQGRVSYDGIESREFDADLRPADGPVTTAMSVRAWEDTLGNEAATVRKASPVKSKPAWDNTLPGKQGKSKSPARRATPPRSPMGPATQIFDFSSDTWKDAPAQEQAEALFKPLPSNLGEDPIEYQKAMAQTMEIYEGKIRQLVTEKSDLKNSLSERESQHRVELMEAKRREQVLANKVAALEAKIEMPSPDIPMERLEQLAARNRFLEGELARLSDAMKHQHVNRQEVGDMMDKTARDLANAYKDNELLRSQIDTERQQLQSQPTQQDYLQFMNQQPPGPPIPQPMPQQAVQQQHPQQPPQPQIQEQQPPQPRGFAQHLQSVQTRPLYDAPRDRPSRAVPPAAYAHGMSYLDSIAQQQQQPPSGPMM